MQTAQQAKERVLKLQHLPPLSATATRLLVLLSEEDLALNKLAKVINQDPGLTARILGLANAAYFGQQNPVLKVEDAIIRVLGLNMVKSLAFSIAVSGAFDISGCQNFDLKHYWRDALSVAMLARQLCMKSVAEERLDPDVVYLAGLLKDIGVLVLVHVFPDDYNKVLQKICQQGSDADILTLESEIIGINHCEAGAWLAHRWHLPDLIVAVIAHNRSEQLKEVALIGAVSSWLSDRGGEDEVSAPCMSALYDCCGLPPETLGVIKVGFIDDEEEIKVIANLLSS
jgi:HD-like signal output (HDOD) protein